MTWCSLTSIHFNVDCFSPPSKNSTTFVAFNSNHIKIFYIMAYFVKHFQTYAKLSHLYSNLKTFFNSIHFYEIENFNLPQSVYKNFIEIFVKNNSNEVNYQYVLYINISLFKSKFENNMLIFPKPRNILQVILVN